jgi:hypothetical protein
MRMFLGSPEFTDNRGRFPESVRAHVPRGTKTVLKMVAEAKGATHTNQWGHGRLTVYEKQHPALPSIRDQRTMTLEEAVERYNRMLLDEPAKKENKA